MERRYPGGYFLAVYIAQEAILALRSHPAMKHVLKHEVEKRLKFFDFPEEICKEGPLCFALAALNNQQQQQFNAPDSALARDVARLIGLYVQKRPAMVHAFYVHSLKQNYYSTHGRPTCEYCQWIVDPSLAHRCSYCQFGACELCVSPQSYSSCVHGCCKLCPTCFQIVMGLERCEADPDCLKLACSNRLATPCKDRGCKGRFCAEHAQHNGHICQGAEKRAHFE